MAGEQMTLSKEYMKSVWLHIVLIFVLYILQTSVFTHLKLFKVYPMLLPLAVVGIGLFEDGLRGGIWGIVAGVFCDMSVAGSSYLFTVSLAAAGFFVGFLSEFILARGFPSFFVLSLMVLCLLSLLQMFRYLVFDGISFSILGKVALYQILYSAVFILPLYYPIRRITRRARN
jgi:cell shape-determining protein MreD